MKISIGIKAEIVINLIIGLEFSYVFLWAFLNQKPGILVLSSFPACFGILRTALWLRQIKITAKMQEDEYIEYLDENARLIGAIAGILVLAQLAVFEIITGTVISAMNAFLVVFLTFIIVFIVSATIPLNIGLGDENQEQVEGSKNRE